MTPGADWFEALPWVLALSVFAWAVAMHRDNSGLVDVFWSLFVLSVAFHSFLKLPEPRLRAVLVLTLAGVWALRLSLFLFRRNWNAPEDHRYVAIRRRNDPGFRFKSLYLVFGFQALLAFIVSAPLHAAIVSPAYALGLPDLAGTALVAGGLWFEWLADEQLAAFRRDPASHGKVMDRGLWRYSRHPNYFGECCIWWGFFLFALSAGAWWTVVSPVLMTVLLLRVSGVTLLERDIGKRRPGYESYVRSTNAFLPGPRRGA